MKESTRDILTQPLTVHFKPGPGGRKYRYVEGRDVISRLNAAFEHDWSSRVINTLQADNQIIVLVELEYDNTVHQGYGGSEIALYSGGQKAGKPVDISNSYKAAFTNALKKAAEQFGVGLVSEDDVTQPTTTTTAPNTTRTYKAPVTGSAVVKTAPATPPPSSDSPAAAEALEKQVRDMLSGKTEMSAQVKHAVNNVVPSTDTPVAQSKPSLAQNYKSKGYDPEASRVPDTNTPFAPSGNGDEMINDIQLHAIEGLSRMKKLEATDLISRAVPGTTKTDYSELTKNEAKAVILTLNNTENAK